MDTEPQSSLTVFRLPRSHWHCHAHNFEWDSVRPRALREHYEKFLEGAASGGAPHLILTGDPGIGKSHLGVAAYRWMALREGTELVTWVSVPLFCDEVKASYTAGVCNPFDAYQDARRFVVLDDLFGRELTPHEASQILSRLLDMAYQNGAGLLITMNPPVEALAGPLPPHEISRLLAGACIVPMTADQDWRRK